MAFYKSKYTGTEIDQRLAQATYDDAVLAGFNGSKEEFDAILGKLKEIADKAENSIQMESENLETFNKNVVDAINELHRELQAKPDEQDVIDQGELQVFKDEIAAKYATRDEFNDDIENLNSKISTLNTNLVESVNTINKNVNDSLTIVNQAIQQNAETLVAEIEQRKEADKEIKNALNNDPNFAATITNELSKKLDSDKLLSGAGINIREEDGKKIVDIAEDALTKIQYSDSEVRRLETAKIPYAYDEKTQSNINVILPEGGSYLGNYGDENATIAKAAVYDGTKQLEIGSSKVHTNINSLDKPTIETPDGKETLVVESDIELIPIEVNFPVRTSGGSDGPEDRVYTEEEILEWFGVADIAALKKQIANKGIQYIKYGIMLMGNPYYYRMPVQYAAFESANQIKLVFTGLNTNNDVVSKYEIIMNLDGTIIEGNSNVKMTITNIEPEDINLSEYATKSELEEVSASIPDVSEFVKESELPKQYIVEEGAALQAGDEQHEFNIKSGDRVTVNSVNEVVTYTPYPGEEGRKMLVLANNDSLTGTKTDGTGAPLAFMSKWNKIEIGNSTTSLNLNSLKGEITINDDKIVATTDQIQAPYEINLTNLLSAEDSESISTAIGGINNLNATVQDNRIIVGTISNGSVSVSIRILGNVTTLYYLLDSVLGLTLNEIAITNTSSTLSKNITTHSVLTENMIINSLDLDETTLPLSAAQGKILNSDKQNKTDETLQTTDKTIVGAINELLAKVQELETKNTELESKLAALEGTN